MTSGIGATARLAAFTAAFQLDEASAVAQARAIDLLIDYFGVKLAAVGSEIGHAALVTLSPRADLPATMVGANGRGSPGDAAFYHGSLAHALEFDDSTLNPVGHPSTVILPAVFALAEKTGASGRAVMQAYHVGLEVHSRLGAAQTGNWSFDGGWLPIGHISLIGAAAACANLLRLDAAQSAHAIGLATQFCGQLSVNSASHAKPFGAGNSARCGLVAALLASEDMTAADAMIERPGGFVDTFFGKDGHNLSAALELLGAPLHIEAVGIAIKRYPSCYGCHWGNDALLDIMQDNQLSAADIARVELAHPASGSFLDNPNPTNSEEAKFSHQYNLAVTALDGMPGAASFSEGRVRRDDVREMMGRISLRVHAADLPSPASWAYLVTMETVGGDTISHSVPRPLGHPRRPMSQADIESKFMACTNDVLSDEDARALIATLRTITDQPDMRAIAAILARSTLAHDYEDAA